MPGDALPGVYLARLVMEDPPAYWRSDASEIQPSSKFANRALAKRTHTHTVGQPIEAKTVQRPDLAQ